MTYEKFRLLEVRLLERFQQSTYHPMTATVIRHKPLFGQQNYIRGKGKFQQKTHKGKKRGNYKTTGETDTDTDDKSNSGIEQVPSDRSTVNSSAIVTKENVRTDTTKVSTANDTNVGKEIHKETTNKGEENNAENNIVNEDQQQEQTSEFSNSDMDILDESDCLSDSKLIYKSNTKDNDKKEKKAKKELDDRRKMYNLEKTIRGWPFIAESLRGRGQRMDRFDQGKEALH